MYMDHLIFRNIKDIMNNFDVFVFDVYGVIWSGKQIYKNIPETMETLRKAGKIIYILSNGTQLSDEFENNYAKKGIIKGIHYDKAITSGEIARDFLLNGKLKFKTNSHPINYYTIGMKNDKLFKNTIYNSVENIEEADFFYFGVPQLTEQETTTLSPEFSGKFFLSKVSNDGLKKQYSITTPEIFKGEFEKVKKLNLPGFNANPDVGTIKNDITNQSTKYGLTQGALVQYYKNLGGEVVEIGKPHKNAFDYIFKILDLNGISIDKSRIAIIGDNMDTDIRGGNQAGIQTILTTETGVTRDIIKKNKQIDFNILDNLCAEKKSYPDFLIYSVAGYNEGTTLNFTLLKQNERN